MGLDIRLPIGWLFVMVGGLLAGFGLFSGIKLNLWWGLVMVLVGGVFLVFSRRRVRA